MQESVSKLSGPKHPATKFYKLRKSKLFMNQEKGYKNSTNPQRSSKKARERRNQKYQENLAQYEFYNRRKTCVNKILNKNNKQCKISIATL